MRFLFLFSFLCLPFTAGRELSAQNIPEAYQGIANKYYRLTDQKMSEDGRWLTIRKSYDLNRDTILIFSSRHPGQPAGYRTKVGLIAFLNNDNLLMQGPHQAELWNPEEQTAIYFEGVKQIQALRSNKKFLLHYNEGEKNRLELRDSCGELLNATDNVSQFYTTGTDHIYAVTENEDGKFRIVLLKNKTTENLYVTSQKISYLEADPGEHGIMVYEQNPDTDSREVLYLDLTTKACFPLKEALTVSIQNGFREVIREGSIYFIKLMLHKEKADTSLADIWYGNDNQLEEKFYPPIPDLRYVWEPKEKRVRQIGNDSLTTNINLGNDRYFLTFDPYYFQDYTTESTPLKMYVYDRIHDRYSVLDTISPELYLSGNGEYVLSPKDREWYLYHIPSGNKKHISGKGPGTPWFTADGDAVFFVGEGALWKYELKSGLLVEEAVFKGCQTSIINGEWEGISSREGMFSKQLLNSLKPLVIRLYDPQENVTSYVLWNKGKSKIIIPPTAMHIQFLKYNKSFDCFSWVEEDYNMPPRLVYRKMGEEKKVLYQSNKADTAILSLRQEIISYIDSDGVPLKGILYYPLEYNPSAKYPMVVHIYEKQRHLANRYLNPSYYEGQGFNIRLLIEKGYFVYLPDIVIHGINGPGVDALDCVNKALDAIDGNQLIDKQRIGLIGHSFGGYETDFIA
ncbi:MAG TPA: hypothetical protein VMV74_03005, partial [Bacteroidales bacterium]|nr:hypothetical protein [Bacteroidales bacterium]